MRALLKVGFGAAFAATLLFGNVSRSLPQPTDEAAELNKRVIELYNAGRYSDAIAVAQQLLATLEKTLGRDHPDVGMVVANLALMYQSQDRYAEAEALFRQALTIQEKALGSDHPAVATSLNNLALFYTKHGSFSEAEALYKRSLVIYEKTRGRDHPAVATTLVNLAEIYLSQNRYSEAESLLQRSLAIRERILGRDHPDVAALLDTLAAVYGKQGRYSDAELLYRRSLAISEKANGTDHTDTIQSMSNLAELYRTQGRYGEAEPLYQRSLAIREKIFGASHPTVTRWLNAVALLYLEQARYANVLPIVKRMMAQGAADKTIAFPTLFQSQSENLIGASQAIIDSYEIVQRTAASAAASAVSKLAARFAAGSGELAQLVRKDQDLTAEAEALDRAVIAFVSKPPAQRSGAAEQQVRKRIDEVKAERADLLKIFNDRFPDYVALSKPQPVPLAETQALLADDEALLVFDFEPRAMHGS
jgi:tetratricopeptide (TPR) repeat protein